VLLEFYPPIPTELPAQGRYVLIDVPEEQLVDVDLGGGVVLDGTVCGSDGVCKVGGVRIEVKRECNDTTGECEFEFEFKVEVEVEIEPPSIVTDEGENFAIPVFPGDYQVTAFPDPDTFQLPEISDIAVPSPSPLEVKLKRGAILTGTVTGGEGAVGEVINECIRVGGEFECEFEIEIEVEPGEFRVFSDTDIDGEYSLLGPPGTHTLLLKAKPGPLLDVAFKPIPNVNIALPGPNNFDIIAEAETEGRIKIEGTVFEPDGVTPAAGVDIFARLGDKFGRANLTGRAYSHLDGSYVLVIK
jgi:hypothetical protein